jgi:hypothetical protein
MRTISSTVMGVADVFALAIGVANLLRHRMKVNYSGEARDNV